jgi:hypothetical protein
LWINKGYQGTSGIESVVVSKVKGVVTTKQYSDAELDVSNPDFYRRIWDASDIVVLSQGDDSGGFIIVTNLVITANQTRGICPEVFITNILYAVKNSDTFHFLKLYRVLWLTNRYAKPMQIVSWVKYYQLVMDQ